MKKQANRTRIQIELTSAQQAQLQQIMGTAPGAVELSAEALEERIAPACITKMQDAMTPK